MESDSMKHLTMKRLSRVMEKT